MPRKNQENGKSLISGNNQFNLMDAHNEELARIQHFLQVISKNY
jgi:hypothetical protein